MQFMMLLLYIIKCTAIGYVVTQVNSKFSASEAFKDEFDAKDNMGNTLLWVMCFIPVINFIVLIFYIAKYIDAKMESKL